MRTHHSLGALIAAFLLGRLSAPATDPRAALASRLSSEAAFEAATTASFSGKAGAKLASAYGGSRASVPAWDIPKGMYLWDWFSPTAPCGAKERVGAIGDGGKWVCELARYAPAPLGAAPPPAPCTVYSFGVRDDSSFEAELHARTRCHIHAFDMTVGGVAGAAAGLPRVAFSRVGLGGWPGAPADTAPLQQLMAERGHAFIDILKIDVEYAEVRAIPALLDALPRGAAPPFEQLLLEVHHWDDDLPALWTLFEALAARGVVPFMSESNHNPSVMGHGPLVTEYSFYSRGAWFDAERAWRMLHGG